MIKLIYSKDEMIAALRKIGYEVKKEKELQTVRGYYDRTEEVEQSVYNCYYKGTRIDLWDYLYGIDRLKNVFEMEIRKKVIELF